MESTYLKIALLLAGAAGGCSERTVAAASPPVARKELPLADQTGGRGGSVRPLPFAHGRTFATLDEYLAHLRDYAGPVGQPWYRKVGQDRYELVTTRMPRGEPETITRAELMARFGFAR